MPIRTSRYITASLKDRPTIQGRVIPKFPAKVVAGYGIDLTVINGVYNFSLSANSGFQAAVVISDVPPPNPQRGTLWWESDSGRTFIWYPEDDESSAQWVQQATIGGQGPEGPAGPAGEPGPPGADGAGSSWYDLTDVPSEFTPSAHIHPQSEVVDLVDDLAAIDAELALKAPLASPALTGTPTAPTPPPSYNDTTIATTEYVQTAIAGFGGGASVDVSDTAPSSPSEGNLWFDSSTARFYIYFSSAWIQIGGAP